MKYLILFENFEEDQGDFWSDTIYCGCGCCSKCNGQDDCECCDNCQTTIYDQEDDSDYERNEPKDEKEKYLDYLRKLELGITDDSDYERNEPKDEKEKYLDYLRDLESTSESTSATGGLSVSGGVSGQPVGLAGQTLSTNWASGTGKEGGGYLNVPYNPGGANRMQQKIPVMGLNHGPRTGKKSREKRLDLKALRASFKKRKEDSTTNPPIPGEKKVMSFDDFEKSDINTIKK